MSRAKSAPPSIVTSAYGKAMSDKAAAAKRGRGAAAGSATRDEKERTPRQKRPRKPKPIPNPQPDRVAPADWTKKAAAFNPDRTETAVSVPPQAPVPEPAAEDRVVAGILAALEGGKSLSPMEVARHIADAVRRPADGPELWRRYMTAVKQQMVHLARQKRIEIVRKGAVVDPEDFKGVVRLRLPKA